MKAAVVVALLRFSAVVVVLVVVQVIRGYPTSKLVWYQTYLFNQSITHLKWEKAKDGERVRAKETGQQKLDNGKMDFTGVFRAVETVSFHLF